MSLVPQLPPLAAVPRYPRTVRGRSRSLVSALLVREPAARLGNTADTEAAIPRHPYFSRCSNQL